MRIKLVSRMGVALANPPSQIEKLCFSAISISSDGIKNDH